MSKRVFFSWQSDDNNKNRNIISASLKVAAKQVGGWDVIDSPMKNKIGFISIDQEVLKEIDKCSLFVADVSIINQGTRKYRKTPNPNVVFELGYACKARGFERVLVLVDESTRESDHLNFDARNRANESFDPSQPTESKRKLAQLFEHIMRSLGPANAANELPYIYAELKVAGNSTGIWLDFINDEQQAYSLEEVIFGTYHIDGKITLRPGERTKFGMAVPYPLHEDMLKFSFVISRKGIRSTIYQEMKVQQRVADGYFNILSITPVPEYEPIK